MTDPIAKIRGALLGHGPAYVAGPWVRYERYYDSAKIESWGWHRHAPQGALVSIVSTSSKSRGRWSVWLWTEDCPRCMRQGAKWLGQRQRIADPSTGRQWLSEAAALDHADHLMRQAGWYLLTDEEMSE